MPKTFLVRKKACSRRLWTECDSDTDDGIEMIEDTIEKPPIRSDTDTWSVDSVTGKSGQILDEKSVRLTPNKDTPEGTVYNLSNDQELVQLELKFRPRNQSGKQLKLQIDIIRREHMVNRIRSSFRIDTPPQKKDQYGQCLSRRHG